MPKPTFFNLPEHKREHIFQHALHEFSHHAFERASLSEIVCRAGIAKGSMYQYFEGKKDLYKYVVQQVYLHKRKYLQPVWDQKQDTDFFKLVSSYYLRSWHYAREYPLYHRVIANFWDSKDANMREEILKEKETRILEFHDLLDHGRKLGIIDQHSNPDAAWFVYHAVGRALVDNFLESDISTSSHDAFIQSVLTVLERGLKTREE